LFPPSFALDDGHDIVQIRTVRTLVNQLVWSLQGVMVTKSSTELNITKRTVI